MEERLLQIFKENGFDIQPNEYNDVLEMDSIQFISIIVAIETEFDLEIPDEILSMEGLRSFQEFLVLVQELLN